MARYVVIGGGIVGLATAHRIILDRPDAEVTVLEKEHRLAAHQTGHNSGVIHAGVYYKPGSLKAELCRAGSRSMVDFCAEQDIPVQRCGKLIVATDEAELPRLRALHERALANRLPVRLLTPAEAAEYEPAVRCVEALRVESTGIVDFTAVCTALATLAEKAGARIRLGARVTGVSTRRGGPAGAEELVVTSTAGEVVADVLVNCAGLHADRVARLAGVTPSARIVPFRGEYYELRPERRDLVRGLIYPVPDPQFPFLGVHLTRMIDGTVHAGPNAVLALAREGYSWGRVNLRELADAVTYPGLWRLARRHLGYGLTEVRRSLSRQLFAASLARLVPDLTVRDLVPSAAGVRAQAIARDGSLVDDFLIVAAHRQVHVLNAPSPAATSSLEIAKHIVARLPE
ncbi:L-2-hydroxyglutarate oxidase [Micromonospora sp. NBC_01796]|uniref:L-2-hydroxyglutarate oxidase n=1 Tax=Micromonospora sp. NBC_01796 TaxID=2975987 RepID=UPI002DD7FD3B|nr:L-2-hydroxyglutarate oxidase [Micromonospora sp. NBC_01796]WSA86894.1 L-2-hydroxyglutarate oxidase [Micromonospora sp. NBC_01796]